MKKSVKRTEMGHAAHFCNSKACRFSLATHISSGYIISTIGDYYPIASDIREEIGSERYFETYVFKSQKKKSPCGCFRPEEYCEIDSLWSNTSQWSKK